MSDTSLQPILALLGYPVAGNPTQYMLEKAIAYHQLDCRFLTLEVAPESLGDAVRGMRAMGFKGGICAEPHKAAVVALLNRTTPSADLSGIANLIYREADELVGDNTEGRALLRALAPHIDPAGKQVTILGAGKVARSIAIELGLTKAAQVVIVARNERPAADLARLLHDRLQVPATTVLWDVEYAVPPECQLLIQATSIGQEDPDAQVPVDVDTLRPDLVVADVILNPPQTSLLCAAQQAGCKTVDGLESYLHNAVLAMERWTNVEPDLTVMREAVEEFLLL